jgi:peroxiredoxin
MAPANVALDLPVAERYQGAANDHWPPRGDAKMTLSIGDKVPSATLMTMTETGPAPVQTDEYFAGRTVALFSVPGAFTPTCSAKHLPGFIEHAEAIKARGVDEIACIAVNDAFVMGAWGKSAGADGKVTMLADGNGDFSEALGLTMDASKFGMGKRGQRFSVLIKDGVVSQLNVEEPGAFRVSSAEHLLEQLA